ncbi:MAG: hypothetical protein VB855_18125 [Pirellulaceae bacterium]
MTRRYDLLGTLAATWRLYFSDLALAKCWKVTPTDKMAVSENQAGD